MFHILLPRDWGLKKSYNLYSLGAICKDNPFSCSFWALGGLRAESPMAGLVTQGATSWWPGTEEVQVGKEPVKNEEGYCLGFTPAPEPCVSGRAL